MCTCDRHLRAKHDGVYQKYSSSRKVPPAAVQPTLDTHITYGSSSATDVAAKYSANNPQQVKFVSSLVKNLVVQCGFPVSIVDTKAFRQFTADINDKLAIPSRQHITNKLIPDLCASIRAVVASMIALSRFVAMTVDIWSDRRMHSFLGVTVLID